MAFRKSVYLLGFGAFAFASASVMGCGSEAPAPEPAQAPAVPAPPPAPEKAEQPDGPLPALLMVQAWFSTSGPPKPQPAKLTIWRTDGTDWWPEEVLDADSSVFHKAVAWKDGILTIAQGMPLTEPAKPAKLSHWTQVDGAWSEEVLWSQIWGGRFQRIRDMELADLDGDGADEIAMATHDMGVVAVADQAADGAWTVHEFDEKADTFVHEVEIGDVDGDAKLEFYVTPSARNKASGVSQPGGVARYDFRDGTYQKSQVVYWEESHAKEILVSDLDGDGTDELYVVKEGHVQKKGKRTKLLDPVTIVRMIPAADGTWTEEVVTKLNGDPQCRFLLAGDVDHDGKTDLVAAGKDTGLWMVSRADDGTFSNHLIDKGSGGFEHAAHAADLDGDGKLELYVASDTQKKFRRYMWDGETWDRKAIAKMADKHITWNLQDGTL